MLRFPRRALRTFIGDGLSKYEFSGISTRCRCGAVSTDVAETVHQPFLWLVAKVVHEVLRLDRETQQPEFHKSF